MADLASQLQDSVGASYAIEREIGRGGMATVYLARDVRHNRRVALKVLSPELGAVLGVERFLSEIRVTANLQHPNLLPLFDSGQANGLLYYVMPYVEGESLRAKLTREKQLPIDEAVHIATAVASALDYAHRHGVIHRDLKPENILLHEGQPLVADFGIALAVTNAGGSRITQTGLSLGTPQYMSPEQATGDREVDARSDVYSLGAVTYEMLTGEPPHTGTTAQAIIAKVLTDRPRGVRLSRDTVPPHVERAVECALAKLPADRFQTAHDFADALVGKSVAIPLGVSTPGSILGGRGRADVAWWRLVLPGLSLLVIGLVAWMSLRPHADSGGTMRFVLALEPAENVGTATGYAYALSPDGRTIVYASARGGGTTALYARDVNDLALRPIAGTEGGDQPTFSPDGRWIAFVAGAVVKKVPVEGGAPIALTTLTSTRGIGWNSRGDIVLGENAGSLSVMSASGGQRRPLTKIDYAHREQDHRWPIFLADGRTIVFTIFRGSVTSSQLAVTTIDGGAVEHLDLAGSHALGVIDGQLVYINSTGTLMSVPFDVRKHRVTGTAIPHISDIFVSLSGGASFAALSQNGNLVYQPGGQISQLVLADLHGRVQPLFSERQRYNFPRFSPDGKRVAVTVTSPQGSDIWIYDRQLGTVARLTDGGFSERPEWTPDGKRLLYRSVATTAIAWQLADRSSREEQLIRLDSILSLEAAISPDGHFVMIRGSGPHAMQDLLYRRIGPGGDTTMRSFTSTPAGEYSPRFSPDGRWVAFSSDEAGSQQVYVSAFPGPGPHYQISSDGGTEPVWAPDGRHLYYARGRTLMAATVALAPTFAVTARDSLFTGNFIFPISHANYDVAPDGRSFLMLQLTEADPHPVFVYNWSAELRREAGKR